MLGWDAKIRNKKSRVYTVKVLVPTLQDYIIKVANYLVRNVDLSDQIKKDVALLIETSSQ
jgi:hypothetical protein